MRQYIDEILRGTVEAAVLDGSAVFSGLTSEEWTGVYVPSPDSYGLSVEDARIVAWVAARLADDLDAAGFADVMSYALDWFEWRERIV